MLDAIEGIDSALAGTTFAEYEQSWLLRRAVERGLDIISEASRHLPDELKQRSPEVPWRQIAGIGNVLRHEYQRVEPRLVWNVARDHLAPLEAVVRAALAAER